MVDGLHSYAVTEAVSKGRAFPEPPHPVSLGFRAGPRPDHPQLGLPAPGGQDAGLLARPGRLLPLPADAQHRGRPDRPDPRQGARAQRKPHRGDLPGARPGPSALRPHGRGDAQRADGRSRRVRAQRPDPADRDAARASVPGVHGPEPDVRDPAGPGAKVRGSAGAQSADASMRQRFYASTLPRFDEPNCTLEGQIADVADRIAYNCHDLEDGLRARLIDGNQMRNIQIYTRCDEEGRGRTDPGLDDPADPHGQDDHRPARQRLHRDQPQEDRRGGHPDRPRRLQPGGGPDRPLPGERPAAGGARAIPARQLLPSRALLEAAAQTRRWLAELFEQLCRDPHRMPSYFRDFIPQYGLQRAVCDYIAGMTDRYCLKLLGIVSS